MILSLIQKLYNCLNKILLSYSIYQQSKESVIEQEYVVYMHVNVPENKKIIHYSLGKDKKRWGQYPELSATSTCSTPRERRRRERTTFGSGYMPTLGPSTCPSKIFSSLDGTTICIRSLSSFLSSSHPQILQWAVLLFGPRYEFDRVRVTLKVSDAR